MKIKLLLPILFLLLSISSCKEEEEVPMTFLNGTYESATQLESGGWVVISYNFEANGNFQLQQTFRNTIDGLDLGFRGFASGSYSLKGDSFQRAFSKKFGLNGQDVLFLPKDQLVLYANNETDRFPGTISFNEARTRFDLSFPCDDMRTDALGICAPPSPVFIFKP